MQPDTGRFRVLNRDQIKYFAILTMLLNHIANIFLSPGSFLFELLVNIGYFTAPTMCRFLVEGFCCTRSRRKYALRLAVFAALSQLPFCLAFSTGTELSFPSMNMMFTLLLCFLLLYAREEIRSPGLRQASTVAVFVLSIFSDWAVLAPFMTLLFARCRDGELSAKNAYTYSAVLFFLLSLPDPSSGFRPAVWLLSTLGGCAAIALSGAVLQFFYNGKRARHAQTFSKWFFYLFYPLHLLLLGMIRLRLGL